MVVNVQVDLRKGENEESLIRRFMSKLKKEGVLKELARKEYHETKSQRKKTKKAKAMARKISESKKREKNKKRTDSF